MSTPPPDGIYVPAVVFLDEHEEIDEAATRAHILRLAEVRHPPTPLLPFLLG